MQGKARPQQPAWLCPQLCPPRAVPCVASFRFFSLNSLPVGGFSRVSTESTFIFAGHRPWKQDVFRLVRKYRRALQHKLSRIFLRCRRPLTCSVLGPRRILEWHPQRNAFKRMSPKFTQCPKTELLGVVLQRCKERKGMERKGMEFSGME